jgi:hypothetical protein
MDVSAVMVMDCMPEQVRNDMLKKGVGGAETSGKSVLTCGML